MNIYVELITFITEIFLTCFFFYKCLPLTGIPYIEIIIYYATYALTLAIGTLFLSIIPRITLIVAVLLIGNHLLLHIPYSKLVYTIILFFTSAIIADILCAIILPAMGMQYEMMANTDTGRILYNSCSKIIHLIILLIIISLIEVKDEHIFSIRIIPLIICHIATFFAFDVNYHYLTNGGSLTKVTISSLCLLYINIMLCIYFEYLRLNHEKHEKDVLIAQQLKINNKFYTDMLSRQEETRALWHDIKKYTLAVEALVADNQINKARDEFQNIESAYEKIKYTVDSGNSIIDGILNHEINLAKNNNITINLNIWIDNNFSIDATDLYIIIGNTIDNAIEACSNIKDTEKRIINISLTQKEHLLLYEVNNPYIPDIKIHSKKPFHGYGLTNVRNCVERNNGTMTIDKTNDIFSISIILNV